MSNFWKTFLKCDLYAFKLIFVQHTKTRHADAFGQDNWNYSTVFIASRNIFPLWKKTTRNYVSVDIKILKV